MKRQPSKIMVAIDGSDFSMNAAEYALLLAKGNRASIVAVNVIDLSSIFRMLPNETRRQLTRIGKVEAHRMLEDIVELAKRYGGNVQTEIIQSKSSVPYAILKYAKGEKIDLIVIGTRGRSGVKKALLGSVASKVVASAECPVLVVR